MFVGRILSFYVPTAEKRRDKLVKTDDIAQNSKHVLLWGKYKYT
jgi:hypothetical protein